MERIVAHRTRVVVYGRAGMVVRIDNAYRAVVNGGRQHQDLPARVHVILDDGRRVVARLNEITIEEASAA